MWGRFWRRYARWATRIGGRTGGRICRERRRLLGAITQGLVASYRFASQRQDEFADGVVVSHNNLHCLEGLVVAQLGGTLDGSQFQRGVGIADPVLAARVVEANCSM